MFMSPYFHAHKYTVFVEMDGSSYWYQDGGLSRHDGPAVDRKDGVKEFWVHGKRHNVNGPAVIGGYCNEYYINGERHRIGGPAIEYTEERNAGANQYYINGTHFKRSDYDALIGSEFHDGKVVELNGVRYQLTEVK